MKPLLLFAEEKSREDGPDGNIILSELFLGNLNDLTMMYKIYCF